MLQEVSKGGFEDNIFLSLKEITSISKTQENEQTRRKKGKLTAPRNFVSLAVRSWGHSCGFLLSMAEPKIVLS